MAFFMKSHGVDGRAILQELVELDLEDLVLVNELIESPKWDSQLPDET